MCTLAQIGNLGGPNSNCNGNQSLPKSCYMQNVSGHFIDYAGQPANCTGCTTKCKQPRLLVADETRAKYCPDSLFQVEGEAFRPVIFLLLLLLFLFPPSNLLNHPDRKSSPEKAPNRHL